MNKQRGLSYALIFIGLCIVASSSFGMTGAVIGAGVVEHVATFIGLAFFMVGCVVLMSGGSGLEKKLDTIPKRSKKAYRRLKEIKRDKAVMSYTELISLAEKFGYVVDPSGNHHNVYHNDGKTPLTTMGKTGPKVVTIPGHGFSDGTYFGIVNALLANNPYEYAA